MIVKKETLYCDRCGEVIPNIVLPRYKLCYKKFSLRKRLHIYRYGVDYNEKRIDLCEQCSKELEKWFEEGDK